MLDLQLRGHRWEFGVGIENRWSLMHDEEELRYPMTKPITRHVPLSLPTSQRRSIARVAKLFKTCLITYWLNEVHFYFTTIQSGQLLNTSLTNDPCLFLMFSIIRFIPASSNLPEKRTGTWARLGCLSVRDITVYYVPYAVLRNIWDNRNNYEWHQCTGFELLMLPQVEVLYSTTVKRSYIKGIRPKPAVAVHTILFRPQLHVPRYVR